MRAVADFAVNPLAADRSPDGDADGDGIAVSFTGALVVSALGAVDRRLRGVSGPVRRIDLAGVDQIDTVGAWTVWRLAREHDAEIVNASPVARRLIDAVGKVDDNREPVRPPRGPVVERVLEKLGEHTLGLIHGAVQVVAFLGQMLIALGSVIRHPGRFRATAVVRQMELVGVSAIGIVGLMSFLIGIVIAQQGAVQLQQFGAEFYTINLTGRLSVRELGVLMTAIMVAGRSGSAFAAQLGTMKLTEEVDAMVTIGVSPMEAMVLPRIIASLVMLPLLGTFSAGVAIVGGAFISALTLDIPFMTFLLRIREVVPETDLWVMLIKALAFGLIVAVAGCYQGLQVKGNSEEVGLRTTAAVVMAIFSVIVLDAFFAVFFTAIGWG